MLQAMSYASLVNQKLCQCSLNIAQAVLQALVATSNCKFPELKPEMNYCSGKNPTCDWFSEHRSEGQEKIKKQVP